MPPAFPRKRRGRRLLATSPAPAVAGPQGVQAGWVTEATGQPAEQAPDEQPTSDTAGSSGEGSLTVLIALGANFGVAVLKSIVAVITGSASMVAEAAHSWADTGNEILLLVADKRSGRSADAHHPLGYGRAAYVWSMIAAFGLFAVGSTLSIIHGIQSLGAAEGETEYLWAYIVLAVAFVLEGTSFLQARRQTRVLATRARIGRLQFLGSTSNPTLRAVFFEDAAALVGLVIAGAAMATHQLTGQPVWDAIGSILVGMLLGFVAIFLLQRNMAFLIGQVADPRLRDTALDFLLARPEVAAVTYLHLEYVGPDKLLVIGSVDLTGNEPEHEAARLLQDLENELERHPHVQRTVLSLAAPGAALLTLGDDNPVVG